MNVTTIGQLLINDALPEDLRSDNHNLDKKNVEKLLTQVAQQYPERYKEIAQKLMMIGHNAVQSSGTSINLAGLRKPPEVKVLIDGLREQIKQIAENDALDNKAKDTQITNLVSAQLGNIKDTIFKYGLANGNPFAEQAASGSRGNANQLMQLVAGDGLVADHKDRVLSVPLLTGYAEGLSPVEYFAASYGARKGSVSTKFATQQAGFFGKQLAQAGHRLVVTTDDCGTTIGIPVDSSDADNEGTVLADDIGDYKRGTVITPKMLKVLGSQPIHVRSPLTCQAPEGICAKCAGVRDRGRLPSVGDNVGMPAAHSLSEKMSQGMLSAKHTGGQVGAKGPSASGFNYVNQLVQVPTNFAGAATLSNEDGRVEKIEPAPQGGKFVFVNGKNLYVPPSQEVTVQVGDMLESGDSVSNGIPNPADITKYKGIGEGRRYFVDALRAGFVNSGIAPNRRNIEAIARGLINHVKITDPDGLNGFLPDDVVPFDYLRSHYNPREGSTDNRPDTATNQYLEKPALHYSIGTRVTPKIIANLKKNKIGTITTHKDVPQFEPVMIRAMESTMRDENWMTRMYGSFLEKGFLDSVTRGKSSPIHDTSFVPSVIEAKDFGKDLKTKGLY